MSISSCNDYTGRNFGYLTAIERLDTKYSDGSYFWLMRCICGKTTIKSPSSVKKHTSCGCIASKIRSDNAKKIFPKYRYKHGMSETRTYSSWLSMKGRVKPNYHEKHLYFDRGIKVCDTWNDFSNFLKDMGVAPTEKHTIDRIDNNKGYSPDNCRWATPLEQTMNRRNTVKVEWKGELLNLFQLSKKLGIGYGTLNYRLKHGRQLDLGLWKRDAA